MEIYKFSSDDNGVIANPYSFEHKCMLLRRDGKVFGKGDGMIRISHAYIIYGNDLLLDSLLSCFETLTDKYGKQYVQGSRAPFGYRSDDISRDQLIMALSALSFNGDNEMVKHITSNLRFKLSEKYVQTPDFWLWRKSLETNSSIWAVGFCLLSILLWIGIVPWNLFWRYIGNFKSIPITEFKETPKSKLTVFDKFIIKIRYQMFYWYLYCWKVYTTPDNIFKPILQKLILIGTEKTNYVCRLLLGDKTIEIDEIDNYPSMVHFRWNKYLDKSNDSLKHSTPEEIESNNIDGDMLTKLFLTLN